MLISQRRDYRVTGKKGGVVKTTNKNGKVQLHKQPDTGNLVQNLE